MNFFKLYIGDYQRDTAHLSVTEHGAFLLMLQHYYATEKPLPVGKALHRMLRAQDKSEREAIDAVAAQFWRQTESGLVNDRADVEITKASAQAVTNRAIAIAREDKRKRARKSNEQTTNRATIGQPNHNQTPDTRHDSAHPTSAGARSGESEQNDGGGLERTEAALAGFTPTPAGAACLAMKAAGVSRVNPSDARLLAVLEQGATAQELGDLAAEAVGKGITEAFGWVLKVCVSRREEAAKLSLAPAPPPGPEPGQGLRAQSQTWLAQQDALAEASRSPESQAAAAAAMARLASMNLPAFSRAKRQEVPDGQPDE